MSANDRFEFITVTASAYDAAALATKLTAHSAQGWEIVSIVPTGGELTAFCRRVATGAAPVVAPVIDVAASAPEPVTMASTPTTPAAQAPANQTPAGWYADPSGRYELRYWDGNAWTEHVARGGQQYTDPPVK
jgi:hypothetical protein